MTIDYLDPGDILSRATIHNGVVYVCGLTASDRSVGLAGQTRQILDKIDDILATAGTDKSKLLMVTIYMADIRCKPEMNQVWVDWLGDLLRPARACVGVDLAAPDVLIEIVATAAL